MLLSLESSQALTCPDIIHHVLTCLYDSSRIRTEAMSLTFSTRKWQLSVIIKLSLPHIAQMQPAISTTPLGFYSWIGPSLGVHGPTLHLDWSGLVFDWGSIFITLHHDNPQLGLEQKQLTKEVRSKSSWTPENHAHMSMMTRFPPMFSHIAYLQKGE